MPLLGLLSLAGIIINNAIVLIDRIETQTLAGLSEHDAIIEAAAQRLRPILMTTLTTILGLMPLMFFGGGVFWVRYGSGDRLWARCGHTAYAWGRTGSLCHSLPRCDSAADLKRRTFTLPGDQHFDLSREFRKRSVNQVYAPGQWSR